MAAAEDRISSLPDKILWRVLSCLPTKLAISTSILSRRWRNLWAATTSLSFSCEGFNCPVKFASFVNFALLHRDHTVPVRSFSLTINSDFRFLYAGSWIRYSANRGLQHLDLRLTRRHLHGTCGRSKFDMSHLRFLRSLVISSAEGTFYMNWPESLFFPLLEKLHLKSIDFYPIPPMAAATISKSCPNLKDWSMMLCCGLGFSSIEVALPLLEYLQVVDCGPLVHLSVRGANIKKLKVRGGLSRILPSSLELSTPRLQTLDWHGEFPCSAAVDSFPTFLACSRVGLSEDIQVDVEPHYDGSLNLLMCILKANRLVADNAFMQLLSVLISRRSIQVNPPSLQCKFLEHLELHVGFGEVEMLALTFLLQLSPNLNTMRIFCALTKGGFGRGGYWDSHGLCLERLHEVTFHEFSGSESEIDFLAFLARAGPALEKICVNIGSAANKELIRQRILQIERPSRLAVCLA